MPSFKGIPMDELTPQHPIPSKNGDVVDQHLVEVVRCLPRSGHIGIVGLVVEPQGHFMVEMAHQVVLCKQVHPCSVRLLQHL